jgi:ribosome-binding protein aMBF1 (putative translation factor)
VTEWIVKHEEPDLEVLEESALFMAQATIQNAINDARLSRSDLAKKMNCPRSFISRMLSGKHNLTIKTMARAILACGFEVGFTRVPIVWK